jgi:DNA-binding SARP family transcriptional activator
MSQLSVRLFGRLSVQCKGQVVRGLNAGKVQELFCYLLLHRDRPHPREALASLLWGDTPTAQSKKYLRQVLWQLQGALRCHVESVANRTLLIDSDWVQLNSAALLWLDVADFERAASLGRSEPSENLNAGALRTLQTAVELYQGHLLEGWYQEWCMGERERLQSIYLTMLDKLMGYCESHELFDAGLRYGALSLRYDKARECTHERLMRMHFLAGDRAAALRQYDRCVCALDEDLGVKPSEVTIALYQQISGGRLHCPSVASSSIAGARGRVVTGLADVLNRLRQLEVVVGGIQHQLHADIQTVEITLNRQAGPDGVERRPPVRSVVGAPGSGRGQKPAAPRASLPGLKTGAR